MPPATALPQTSTARRAIGAHLSIAKGYAGMARTARRMDATTLQFFTRNPRGGAARALDPQDVRSFHAICAESGIATILAHAPYTLNPAGKDERVRDFARRAFAEDLVRMEETPGQLYNFHPGAHVGQGAEAGIALIADLLNATLREDQTTTVLLETMAGKGTEVGRTFQELAAIIDRVELGERMGVCLDICHVWDAGYDIVGDLDGVLEEFDQVVGLARLRAIHLNDSQNERGSHKDRHACLGEGRIGFEALVRVTEHPALAHLPLYLETPLDDAGHAREIARLREVWGEASTAEEA